MIYLYTTLYLRGKIRIHRDILSDLAHHSDENVRGSKLRFLCRVKDKLIQVFSHAATEIGSPKKVFYACQSE